MLSDLSLRSLGRLEPPSPASWETLAPTLSLLDQAGFQAIEAWGDLTFERCLRVLRESPWERLAHLGRHITRTPLQMELRGRCLLGSRPFERDVVRAFVHQATACGVRAFMVYECLNDLAGLEALSDAVHSAGARLTLGLVYSPAIMDTAAHIRLAGSLADMGAAAICVKTGEGVVPDRLAKVVLELTEAVPTPIEIDLDNAGALGPAVAVACVRAGAAAVHGSVAPFWLDPSSLPLSVLVPLLIESERGLDIDYDALTAAAMSLGDVVRSNTTATSIPSMLHDSAAVHWRELIGVPADVLRQVAERLRALQAGGRLPEVLVEIGRVRSEIGDPALVPPIAQIVATQAVLNVIYQKRWQLMPDEMKLYLRGGYGPPPRSPSVPLLGLHGETDALAEDGEGDAASLAALTDGLGDLGRGPDDVLLYALAPTAAPAFLERRRAAGTVEALFDPENSSDGLNDLPDRWRDLGPDRVAELVELLEASSVDELVIENQGTRISLKKGPQPAPVVAPVEAQRPSSADKTPLAPTDSDDSEVTISASMVGTFYRSPAPGAPPFVDVGSEIKTGDPLCILEAMKLTNELLSEVDGEIIAVLAEDGSAVEYGRPLFRVRLHTD